MGHFRVLVTDTISEGGLKKLTADGTVEVDIVPGVKTEELGRIMGSYDAVITRSGTSIPASVLERPGKLKVIGRAGVGASRDRKRRRYLHCAGACTGARRVVVAMAAGSGRSRNRAGADAAAAITGEP